MGKPIDYRASAESSIEAASHSLSWKDDRVALVHIGAAQAMATLALAEQQRLANLISLMQMQEEIDENTNALAEEALWSLIEMVPVEQTAFEAMGGPDERPSVRENVRRTLGL